MNLAGKTIVISGSASGLGWGAAQYCVQHKRARVVMLDTAEEIGHARALELGAENALFIKTDISEEGEVREALGTALTIFGAVDACFNFAGVVGPMRVLDKSGTASSGASFCRTVMINLVGTYLLTSHCSELMARNEPDEDGERGVIVNISSGAAFDGQVGQAAYASSKAGVVGLSLPVARELAAWGIRINSIAPGAFNTPMLQSLPASVVERIAADFQFPKRFGHPDEIAGLCAYICENKYINGECIRLDGAFRLPPR